MSALAFRRLGLSIAILLVPGTLYAYTVASGFGEACHESITSKSFIALLREVGHLKVARLVEVPDQKALRALMHNIPPKMLENEDLSEVERFLLVSFILGIRAPDTDGHSVSNLQNLRKLHGDPADAGQYAHSLRGLQDDFEEGDVRAVAGLRQTIDELLHKARDLLAGQDNPVFNTNVYLDFYGQVEVPVFRPVFYAGMALHAVQDSFSHTIRSDADDLQKIVTVLNYIDAISPGFDEDRDGLAHSDSMDDCNDPDAADLTAAATRASIEFAQAVQAFLLEDQEEAPQAFFDKWLSLKTGCNLQNDFCDNARWLAQVRKKQTEPYFEAIFGCQIPAGTGSNSSTRFLPYLALLWAWARRRRPAPLCAALTAEMAPQDQPSS